MAQEPVPTMEISHNPEWLAVRNSPVLLPYLRQTVESHKQEWAQWGYDSDDPHAWVKNNAKALGIVGWLTEFIDQLENLGRIEAEQKEAQERTSDR